MYTIYVDDDILYNPLMASEGYAVTEATLTQELDKTGYMYITVPCVNPLINSIHKMTSTIVLRDDSDILFRGRVLRDTRNFDKSLTLYCEGELAFLIDNILSPYDNAVCAAWQPFITWLGRAFNGTAGDFFRYYVYVYNTQVETSRQFTLGTVTATASTTQVEIGNKDYPTIWDEINDKILEPYGGHIRVWGHSGEDTRYIDWIEDYDGVCGQPIVFGENLLDIEDYVSAEDVVTVLIPLGKDLGSPDGRVNIKTVNNNELQITDVTGQSLFGNIWEAHVWEDEEDPATLKALGEAYLAEKANPLKTLTIKAVDLGGLLIYGSKMRLGDKIQVSSPPHGINAWYQCTRISIDLLDAGASEYTFGAPQKTMTSEQAKTDKSITARLTALERGE